MNIFSADAVAAFLALSAACVEGKARSNHRRSRLSRESSPRSKKASSDPEASKLDGNDTRNRTLIPFFPGNVGSRGEGIIHAAGDPDGIVGGEQMPPGLYPFLVSITYPSGQHTCGGSLISPQVVLSAAHCPFVGFVDLNRYDLTDDTDVVSVQICQTETDCPDDQARAFTHPDYDVAAFADNDFAVIVLPYPISYWGLSIDPVTLNTDSNFPVNEGDPQDTFGWGRTSNVPPQFTNVPMIADLEYIPNDVCGSSYSGITQITDNMLCAHDPAQAICAGDSGGPIISITPDGPVQVGITSFSSCVQLPNGELDCCPVGDDVPPSAFARVSAGYPWILEAACPIVPDDELCEGSGYTANPTQAPTPYDNPCLSEPGTSHVKIDIFTDNYPSETSWNLVNDCNGETVLEVAEGDYDQGNTLYSQEECVPAGQSWNFTINDMFGDGLCCTGGWYAVMYNGVEVAYGEGDSFDFEAIEQFGTCTGTPPTPPPTNPPTTNPPTTKSPSMEPPTSPPTMKPTTSGGPASKSSKKGTKSAKVSKSGKAAAIQSDMNRGMFKSMSMCMSMSETTLEFDWRD